MRNEDQEQQNNEDQEQQNMEQICFRVPAPLLEQARELALAEGWRVSELYRIFWEKGFAAHAEASNKRLVNKGLREGTWSTKG